VRKGNIKIEVFKFSITRPLRKNQGGTVMERKQFNQLERMVRLNTFGGCGTSGQRLERAEGMICILVQHIACGVELPYYLQQLVEEAKLLTKEAS